MNVSLYYCNAQGTKVKAKLDSYIFKETLLLSLMLWLLYSSYVNAAWWNKQGIGYAITLHDMHRLRHRFLWRKKYFHFSPKNEVLLFSWMGVLLVWNRKLELFHLLHFTRCIILYFCLYKYLLIQAPLLVFLKKAKHETYAAIRPIKPTNGY